jgi:putative ABC transport system permease protein
VSGATATAGLSSGPPAGLPSALERLKPARLGPRDVLRVGSVGLRTRRVRAVLSALGIAIGIAAMVSVLGISNSSRADLQATLDKLGTNMLTVTPGKTMFGDSAVLPVEAPAMVGRIGPVTTVSATGKVTDTHVYRSDKIPAEETSGIAVLAVQPDLLTTVAGRVHSGTWLNKATARYPAVVLGATTASRLGIGAAGPDLRVWIGGQWFTVIGILEPVALADDLDSAAMVGFPVAQSRLGFDGYPSTIYERSDDNAVEAVGAVLAQTANPEHPEQVDVSRPSDALDAKNAVDASFTGLLLGLGGVALLVGGVGVANTMVISVLERRNEIGLRRALGATRGQVRSQFLSESLLLSALGGVAGVLLGTLVTAVYASTQHWPTSVPLPALGLAALATLVVGGVAGAYPASRAARLTPTAALATT